MNKKILFVFFLLIILVYLYLIYNPIIIESTEKCLTDNWEINNKNYLKGDDVRLFNTFNFDKDNWRVCVIISDRIDISPKVPYGKYLHTTNINTIKKMRDLSFEYTGGDMATVENEIIFYKNNKMVFRSYIVLDKNITGFQSSDFGWIRENGTNMILIIAEFNRTFIPIVYL